MTADTPTRLRLVADELERLALVYEAESQPQSDTAYAVDVARPAFEKAERLLAWFDGKAIGCGDLILHDAIRQATKPETVEWLAAIAERYGFDG